MADKVILSYSGGLDTSIILHWLQKELKYDVIAYCADVGQEEDLQAVEQRADQAGAIKTHILDLKEEFVKDYVFSMLRANAIYEMRYLLGTAIARPLIAKKQVEIALQENAVAVSHGSTGKGNDQVRFELAYMALAPHLKIIAPWKTWSFQGRNDLIHYAQKNNIPLTVTKEKIYSMDANLLHTSYEGGILEDPYKEPLEDMFLLTQAIENTPNTPEYVEIEFKHGDPIAVNNKKLTPVNLLKELNTTAGKHGIGRIDIVENRLVGIKSRGVYETPGGTILFIAHRDLESITLEKDLQHLKDDMSVKYARLIYNGQWFSPEREALQSFIDSTQKTVNGIVRLKLFKGNVMVVGRKSKNSLYKEELASFESDDDYNQEDAEGFIKLFGLTSKNSYLSYLNHSK